MASLAPSSMPPSGPPPPAAVSRLVPGIKVSQIDASRLDEEVTKVLLQQVASESILGRWRYTPLLSSLLPPEWNVDVVDLAGFLIRFFLFYATTWRDRPSPGLKLQNLKLVGEEKIEPGGNYHYAVELTGTQKVFYGAWVVLGEDQVAAAAARVARVARTLVAVLVSRRIHLVNKIKKFLFNLAMWLRLPAPPLRLFPHGVSAREVLHLAAFLQSALFLAERSAYPNVICRLLRIRMVPLVLGAQRLIAADYMSRLLAWQAISQVLITLLPMVNLPKARRYVVEKVAAAWAAATSGVARIYRGSEPVVGLAGAGAPRREAVESEEHACTTKSAGLAATGVVSRPRRVPRELSILGCAICDRSGKPGQVVSVPTEVRPCGHVFCWTCVAGEWASATTKTCPQCGEDGSELRVVGCG